MKLKDVSSKGKFDVTPSSGKSMKLKDIQASEKPEEPGIMEDVGNSIAEGVKHPLDTADDFMTGFNHDNILRRPVEKGISAIEAGAGKLNEMIHGVPERSRISFQDRLMDKFNKRESEADAAYDKAGARSPAATSIGGATGSFGSAAAIPSKITKVGEPIVWQSGYKEAAKLFPRILGMTEKAAINTGTAAATEGLGSRDKVFDLGRAGEAGQTSLATQALLELAPRTVRAGFKAGTKAVEKVGQTGLGALAGGTISHALGLGHDLAGTITGATVGAMLDMYQPRLAQASKEAAEFLSRNGAGRLGKFGAALETAAQKGPLSLGLTHLIMMDNNPEYAQIVNAP